LNNLINIYVAIIKNKLKNWIFCHFRTTEWMPTSPSYFWQHQPRKRQRTT